MKKLIRVYKKQLGISKVKINDIQVVKPVEEIEVTEVNRRKAQEKELQKERRVKRTVQGKEGVDVNLDDRKHLRNRTPASQLIHSRYGNIKY